MYPQNGFNKIFKFLAKFRFLHSSIKIYKFKILIAIYFLSFKDKNAKKNQIHFI